MLEPVTIMVWPVHFLVGEGSLLHCEWMNASGWLGGGIFAVLVAGDRDIGDVNGRSWIWRKWFESCFSDKKYRV